MTAKAVCSPDGSANARTIQTAARTTQAHTSQGRGLPTSRSRRLYRVVSVMHATLDHPLRCLAPAARCLHQPQLLHTGGHFFPAQTSEKRPLSSSALKWQGTSTRRFRITSVSRVRPR